MKRWFRISTVTDGIWRLFALAALIVALFVGALYWHLWQNTVMAQGVKQTASIEREWRRLGEALVDSETGQRGYLLTGSDAYLEPYRLGAASTLRHIKNLQRLIVNADAREILVKIVPVVEAKLAELAETVSLARQGKRDQALDIARTHRGKQLMDEFRRLSAEALELEIQLLQRKRADFFKRQDNILLSVLWGGIAAITALLVIALTTAAKLNRPIGDLLEGIQAIADGDLDHRVPISDNHEIGRLAAAFNTMAAHILEARRARDALTAELMRSNAELDSFAYVASHDLKAPLRGIRNLADWITEDLGEGVSEDIKDHLKLLRNRADRLNSLLESLLDYSRVGRKNGAVEPVDTSKLTADIVGYLVPPPAFTIETAGPMPTLATPRAPLEKVLRNLIGNALKHHDRPAGIITVSTADVGDYVEFGVADDGPGIPAEFHERIFQMFQTLKPRDQVEGSGMGLAIVKKTVESFGGAIRVESAPPLRGATFVFSWPKRTFDRN